MRVKVGVLLIDTSVLIDWENRWKADRNFYGIAYTLKVIRETLFPDVAMFQIWIPHFVRKEQERGGGGSRFLNHMFERYQSMFKKCCIRNNRNSIITFGKGVVLPTSHRNFGEVDALLQAKSLLENVENLPRTCRESFGTKSTPSIRIKILTADRRGNKILSLAKEHGLANIVHVWDSIVGKDNRLKELFPGRASLHL